MGTWLKRFSILALLGFPIALLLKRSGVIEFGQAFNVIAASLILALVILVLGLIVAYWQRSSNPNSSRAAKLASLISLIPLLGIGAQIFTAQNLPKIHNISTDTVNPPQFIKIEQMRGKDDNPLAYDTAKLAEQQIAAYPMIKTLQTSLSKEDAYKRSLSIAEALGWQIINEDAVMGIVEATDTTALWGFKDDVVIRISETSNSVNIDLRSVSRIGLSDLGANAKRIKKFIDAFQSS